MKWIKNIHSRIKAVSLFETIISLSLIMLAFAIVGQTFIWSNKGQFEEMKERINERNIRYEHLLKD